MDGIGDTQRALTFKGDVSKPKDVYLDCLPHISDFIFQFIKTLDFIVVKGKDLPDWVVAILADDVSNFTQNPKSGDWSFSKKQWKAAKPKGVQH